MARFALRVKLRSMTSVLRAREFPVPHGFSTRQGGVSTGPFSSLNLSFAVGDAPARVEANHASLARAGGYGIEQLHRVSQVHGGRVLDVQSEPGGVRAVRGEADALWSEHAGATLGISTADCVPILIADPIGRRVAAAHSGWRGTESEIVRRTVEALLARGSRPENLRVAIGPFIRECCYEVSDELATRFRARFGEDAAQRRGERWHLALGCVISRSLEAAGVAAPQVDDLQRCTMCEPDLFFSHRRDAGMTGRHLSFVVCAFQ